MRIGSCFPEPVNARMLATWLSYDDLTLLCASAIRAGQLGCRVIWGASANQRSFWGRDGRAALGWAPLDSADPYAAPLQGKLSDNPVVERYQGGDYTAIEYSRADGPPDPLF